MKLLIKNQENEILLDKEIYDDVDDKVIEEIETFNSRETISYLIEFKEGVSFEQVSDIPDIDPESIKQIVVLIK